MTSSVQPLRVQSLKDMLIARLEELILSGKWQAGERLPAERDLAARLGVSRPVLHEALVDLAAKGLVSIIPRRGVRINDYRKSGSVAILSSLLTYNQGEVAPQFADSLFQMRILLETETARLAAIQATEEDIIALRELLQAESAARADQNRLTELDFELHLRIAIASGNLVYPLMINSFKAIYTHFTSAFFARCCGTPVLDEVFALQQALVQAIAERQPQAAAERMTALLTHGEKHLKGEL